MINSRNKQARYKALVESYRSRIPRDLRDILLPEETAMPQLAVALKRLRFKEEERYYVTEIQRRYGIPLRPNESVKKTMIRVRLDILKKRRETGKGGGFIDIHGPLPTDPLE